MKRLLMMLLAILCLTGCATPESTPEQPYFTFTYSGVEISPHTGAAPVIAALGEPKSYTEETSCAFDGVEKTYDYGSFYLSTYPMNGEDYVYTVWFADDTVATDEGIRIGSTQSRVEEVYGKESFNGSNSYVVMKEQSKLVILVADGLVNSVRYEGILN